MTKTMRGCNTDETGLALANVAKKPLFPGNKKKKKLLGRKCRYCDKIKILFIFFLALALPWILKKIHKSIMFLMSLRLERVETWFPLWKGDW